MTCKLSSKLWTTKLLQTPPTRDVFQIAAKTVCLWNIETTYASEWVKESYPNNIETRGASERGKNVITHKHRIPCMLQNASKKRSMSRGSMFKLSCGRGPAVWRSQVPSTAWALLWSANFRRSPKKNECSQKYELCTSQRGKNIIFPKTNWNELCFRLGKNTSGGRKLELLSRCGRGPSV